MFSLDLGDWAAFLTAALSLIQLIILGAGFTIMCLCLLKERWIAAALTGLGTFVLVLIWLVL